MEGLRLPRPPEPSVDTPAKRLQLQALEYSLFLDRREKDNSAYEARAAERLSTATDELLWRLRCIDWAHPALLVYREPGEDRWSQVLLGLNKPEFGEGDGHRDPSFLDGN